MPKARHSCLLLQDVVESYALIIRLNRSSRKKWGSLKNFCRKFPFKPCYALGLQCERGSETTYNMTQARPLYSILSYFFKLHLAQRILTFFSVILLPPLENGKSWS